MEKDNGKSRNRCQYRERTTASVRKRSDRGRADSGTPAQETGAGRGNGSVREG